MQSWGLEISKRAPSSVTWSGHLLAPTAVRKKVLTLVDGTKPSSALTKASVLQSAPTVDAQLMHDAGFNLITPDYDKVNSFPLELCDIAPIDAEY